MAAQGVVQRCQFAKRPLALMIAAHNEEAVLADTIDSAVRAGQALFDIYVVDDASTDRTRQVARELLGAAHVLSVPRSGKGAAIRSAIGHFKIVERYYWLHLADADGVFAVSYFTRLRRRLNLSYAAVTGHIQSLRGGWISKYRLLEYTLGLEILRRIQAYLNVIPVMPGPTSIYRTDILPQLDFAAGTLTEDMDVTFQIHRRRLGRIAYVPEARTYTQDPKDFGDYYHQIQRWYRGNFQVISRHRIGHHGQRLDVYICYVLLEQLILLGALMLMPIMAWYSQNYITIALLFVADLVVFLLLTLWAAVLNRRLDIVVAFPLFYILRAVNLYVFTKAWYEIIVLRKFQVTPVGWDTEGRRYRLATDGIRA